MIYQCWKTAISKKCDSRVIRLHLFMFLAGLAMCATSCIFTQEGNAEEISSSGSEQSKPDSSLDSEGHHAKHGQPQGPRKVISMETALGPNHVHPFGNFGKFTLDMFSWDLRASASVPTSRNGGDVVSVFFLWAAVVWNCICTLWMNCSPKARP